MEKVKVNYEITNEEETVTIAGKNGDKIVVRKYIPYSEKEAYAYEQAAASFVIDEEDQMCYESYKRPLVETYLLVKYYTNIDVDDIEDDAGYMRLFDYLVANDLYDKLVEETNKDYRRHVDMIEWLLRDAAVSVYEKKNSIGYKLMQTFGFLFTGEDLSDQIAAAEDINGKMIDMFKAVQERDAKNALLKNGKAKVNSGGAVLNMAKK